MATSKYIVGSKIKTVSGDIVESVTDTISFIPDFSSVTARLDQVDLDIADLQADVMNAVDLDQPQSITGLKTFETLPQGNSIPSNNKDLVNKAYVDSEAVSVVGTRGELKGFETAKPTGGNPTITKDSNDTITMDTTGSVTITFTPASATEVATKVIALKATGITTLNVSGAVWANKGSAPTWGQQGKHLILVAHFINARVVLSVFDNDQ